MPSLKGFCLIWVSMLLVACTTQRPPTTGIPATEVSALDTPTGTPTTGVPAAGQARFKLYVLGMGVDELDLGYTVETCFPRLKAVNLDSPLMLLTEADIEAYDWSHQVMTSTTSASQQITSHLSHESLKYYIAGSNTFVVTFDDVWTYGGMFSNPGSARYARYPAIFFESPSPKVVALVIRPSNTYIPYWLGTPSPASSVVMVPEIRDYFRGLGKLIEGD